MWCPGGSRLDPDWKISGRQLKRFDYWLDSSLHYRITINLLNAIMTIQPYKKMLLFVEMHIDIFRRGTSNWVKFYKVHMSQSSRTISLNGWPFFTNSTFFSTSRHLFKPFLLPGVPFSPWQTPTQPSKYQHHLFCTALQSPGTAMTVSRSVCPWTPDPSGWAWCLS